MRAEDFDPDAPPHADGRPEARQHAGDGPPDAHRHRDHHEHHGHHPHLLDADEDRWRWRAKIRRDPRKLFFYRIGIAVAGLFLMIASIITGPLPGPGGIPLFLLGLAVWASEFEWAQSVMLWFRRLFHRLRMLPRSWKVAFWSAVLVCALGGMYASAALFGVPSWFPHSIRQVLQQLPMIE